MQNFMWNNKYLLLSAVIFLLSLPMFGQTKIGGLIKDETGEPVAFANVTLVGSTEGTVSDENGKFYFESDATYQLASFSFIGYKTKEVPLTSRVNLNMVVLLEEDTQALGEVVIYG